MWRGKHCRVSDGEVCIVTAAYDWVGAMITALTISVIIFSLFIRVVNVDGTSMCDTLMHQDKLVLYCHGNEYEYGDIVVIDRHTQAPLIKRVIGVGGDRIMISDDGRVYRNGEELEEPYAVGATYRRGSTGDLTVPKGHLFVLGDNRVVSHDSRSAEVGFVPVGDVVGKAVLRIWPPHSFGGVYGNMEVDS